MAFDYRQSQAYFRDNFVPFAEANVSIASSPVLYGLSIYTVFAASWNPKQAKLFAFRLPEHYRRLDNSCKIMGFDSFSSRYSYEEFEKLCLGLLVRNKVQEDVLVRVTMFIDEILSGTKINGLRTALAMFAYSAGPILPLEGVAMGVSSWIRSPDNAIPARAKVNGNYVNASLMKNEAILNGYDDAIALDGQGHVAESTVANLCIVRDGVIISPDNATDILEGITRDTVKHLAKRIGVEYSERAIDRTELYVADEVFVIGSSAKISPVLSIDKRVVGTGEMGEITGKLAIAYRAAQYGEDEHFQAWLTEVA